MSQRRIVGVAIASALALLACGCAESAASTDRAGGAIHTAPIDTPRGSTLAVLPSSTNPGSPSVAESTPAVLKPLKAAQLQAALLPASAFGIALTTVYGDPQSSDEYDGDAFIRQDCANVVQPLEALTAGIGSQSHAESWSTTSAGHLRIATEQADQFQPGDAAGMMRNLVKRVDGDCGSFTTTDHSDVREASTATERAVASLGSQAIRIDVTTRSADVTELTQVLWVRYGDVVICVSYLSVDPASARSYDLGARAKQIASNLKLNQSAGSSEH